MSALTDQIDLDQTSAFHRPEEFGVAATFTHGISAPAAIQVSLMTGYEFTDPAEVGYSNNLFQAHCRTLDVASAVKGDTLVIGPTTYYVLEKRPGPVAMTILILSLSAP